MEAECSYLKRKQENNKKMQKYKVKIFLFMFEHKSSL